MGKSPIRLMLSVGWDGPRTCYETGLPEAFGDRGECPCGDAGGDAGFEEHARYEDDASEIECVGPEHGIGICIEVADEP